MSKYDIYYLQKSEILNFQLYHREIKMFRSDLYIYTLTMVVY